MLCQDLKSGKLVVNRDELEGLKQSVAACSVHARTMLTLAAAKEEEEEGEGGDKKEEKSVIAAEIETLGRTGIFCCSHLLAYSRCLFSSFSSSVAVLCPL